MPRWLALLLVGVALGAGAVIFVQERYLPPRLSAEAAAELRAAFGQADAERVRLKGELADTAQRLESALAERKGLATELASSTESVKRLREDVGSLVASLPPDPRSGAIAVRAARFTVEGSTLAYDVVLSRERPGAKPFGGVLQFIVSGASERGAESTVASTPVPVSIGNYDSVRGSVALPQGFKPRQTTINVLDKVGGKVLGMRVMYVK
ncbi:MAG: hypothetical protein ABI809_00795 [Caldimonas sp.]